MVINLFTFKFLNESNSVTVCVKATAVWKEGDGAKCRTCRTQRDELNKLAL